MRKLNLILSVILISISGLVYLMISQLPSEASLYPIFVNTIFSILSIILLFKTYFNNQTNREESNFINIELKQLLFVLAISGLYVALINIIGYVVSTALYVLIILLGLKVDRIKSSFISFGFCLFVYILFKILLRVPLPKGIII
ncbi:tripartite tricarboxylate transporter TctB family protein [Tissierellaceae bacterium HCP3S3_D8]